MRQIDPLPAFQAAKLVQILHGGAAEGPEMTPVTAAADENRVIAPPRRDAGNQ